MKPKLRFWLRAWMTGLVLGGLACTGWCASADGEGGGLPADRSPRLSPDYAGVTIPPNLAPLNFVVAEPGARYRATWSGPTGGSVSASSKSGVLRFASRGWRDLLRANTGGEIWLEVSVADPQGRWSRYDRVTNLVARETIDGTLVYRRLKPLYNIYRTLGIYQRDLETFDERPVLENTRFDRGCLNCHTFLNHTPETMALHVRKPGTANPMLLVRSNRVAQVARTLGYLSWHPSGRLLAFSSNKLSLFFHTTGETRDVFDADSDLGIYRVDSNTVFTPPAIALPDRNETWPCWAPDGRHLYYCSAPKLERRQYREVRYDLVRVGYDLEHDTWGPREVMVAAAETQLSACQPRLSPDGRFLVFVLAPYGNFPIYQPAADLYLMDLREGTRRRMELNSAAADSWHCWSSNGRWLVFSSKRRDGLFARPYFSYIDREGRSSKPFLLPQEDPGYFDECLQTLNVPELVARPVSLPQARFAEAILKPDVVLTPAAPTGVPVTGASTGAHGRDAHMEEAADQNTAP